MGQGVGAEWIYPEYWTDVNIAICPSDSRSNISQMSSQWEIGASFPPGGFLQNDDLGAELDRIAANFNTSDIYTQLCAAIKLSLPISYNYTPYLSWDQSSLILAHIADAYAVWPPDATPTVVAEDLTSYGCAGFGGAQYSGSLGMSDMTSADIEVATGGDGILTWATDDGGDPFPGHLYRMREGIERILITDINNPGSSNVAQSNVPVMYDAWAGEGSSSVFNHIPGGSNTLFMDGHVEFRKFPNELPLRSTMTSIELPSGWPLYQWSTDYYRQLGGWE